ncbi:MAG TPA: ABC transporter ATP-binding protein [Steroidobacteraceae bacterium]|jgi:peptide/nickel transport system ATP-binding protein|nr:ABC transporter ATP-binding protein [Steroidobacteraceae bacterium]
MPSIPASAEDVAPLAAVLELERLSVTFGTRSGEVAAAREVTLAVARGECLGVVGESGAGKSQVFLAALGLLAANGRASGSARFQGTELIGATPGALDRIRGAGIGMVFQDPMTSLTPHLTVGGQLIEVIVRHTRLAREAAARRALALLEAVQLTDPARRLRQYPHELSGGMRQRVMIAIALGCDPQLLIADEPTTALDVTVQAQILALLADLKRSRSLAMVLITHDVGVVAGLADRLAVMRAGRVVESGSVRAVLESPREPYTRELLRAAQLPAAARAREPPEPRAAAALTVTGLGVEFGVGGALGRRAQLTALREVSFELAAGEALGVVGESGGGKSTLARAVLALLKPSRGRIVWLGHELGELDARQRRALRANVQIVFQDPLGSLDPRMTVEQIVAEPLRVHRPAMTRPEHAAAIATMLARVGLDAALLGRYPHELSGGQCQRVGIARAMIVEPRILVCDEPLSALDAPTQREIVALLQGLQRERGMALLFVSHNLGLVSRLCDRSLVLYLGRMLEITRLQGAGGRARHPYTRELLDAVPLPDPQLQPARLKLIRPGEPPSPLDPPSGCVYRTRCRYAIAVCAERVPAWEDAGNGERVACHRWRELP